MMGSVVLRSKIRFLDVVDWEWYIVSSPLKRGLRVSRKRALQYIAEKGLVLSHSCDWGDVYDTPDRKFWSTWHKLVSDNCVSGGMTFKQRMESGWNKC